MIRRDEAEKREIIHLVEHSALSVKKTLDELQVPRSTFYRWYKQYLEDGEEGLEDHRPSPHQIWNRIPQQVKQLCKSVMSHTVTGACRTVRGGKSAVVGIVP